MIKRILVVAFTISMVGMVTYFVASLAKPSNPCNVSTPTNPRNMMHSTEDFCAYDFSMRMNEIDCLKSGINPYVVWHQDVYHALYYPHNSDDLRTVTRNQPINAYTPWAYVYLYPLSFLHGHPIRWCIYYFFIVLCLLSIMAYSFRCGYIVRRNVFDGFVCLASSLLVAPAIRCDVFFGNFALIISAGLIAMAISLNHRCDVIAGALLALVMVKPQIALLFVIPLLIDRRFKTVLIAALICILASIPPALLCHTSILDLIFQAPKASVHGFTSCALMPSALSAWLNECLGLSIETILSVTAFVGMILCFILSWMLRHHPNWLVRFSPCAILSVSWTYQLMHSHCVVVIAIIAMACEIIALKGKWQWRVFCLISILLFAKVGCPVSIVVERFVSCIGDANGSLIGDIIRQTCSFLSVISIAIYAIVRRTKTTVPDVISLRAMGDVERGCCGPGC